MPKKTEVRGSGVQSLQDMWPTAGLFEKIRHVQDMFPEIVLGGRSPWSYKIKLVDNYI